MNSPCRCSYCGRFIAYDDFDEGKARTLYEPDSHFGTEKIEHYHVACDEVDAWNEEQNDDGKQVIHK